MTYYLINEIWHATCNFVVTMKNLLLSILLFLMLTAFNETAPVYRPIEQINFGPGERLDYKVKFGIFNIANAYMEIQHQTVIVNQRECYKMDVYGKTTGMAKWINSVDDHWGAYVDTEALVPQVSYRNIKEGKYRKNEVVNFDHHTLMAETRVIDKKTGQYKEPKEFKIPREARDLISGYSYLRTINFDKYEVGELIKIEAFFEDTLYDLEIIYEGRDQIKTKIGKMNAIKLVPIMPDNKLFDGENAITVWLSDDENKIPLKIEVDMFVGHAGMEIVGFENLKSELNHVG